MQAWITVAINRLKEWEGFRANAYQDVGGVWTIGYGETGPDIKQGSVTTYEKASEFLVNKVLEIDDVLDDLIKIPLNYYQRAALISFSYNVGLSAFSNSTLLRFLNQGKYDEVPAQLKRWVKDSKLQDQPGLVARRNKEIELWQTLPIQTQQQTSGLMTFLKWLMGLLFNR